MLVWPGFSVAILTSRASNRTRTRRPTVALPDLPAPVPNHDRLDQLYAAIAQLPELDRSLILLHLDGLTYAEIAQVLGLSETNIGARHTRLRQRLKETLSGTSNPTNPLGATNPPLRLQP